MFDLWILWPSAKSRYARTYEIRQKYDQCIRILALLCQILLLLLQSKFLHQAQSHKPQRNCHKAMRYKNVKRLKKIRRA